jgi:hypothetical protein
LNLLKEFDRKWRKIMKTAIENINSNLKRGKHAMQRLLNRVHTSNRKGRSSAGHSLPHRIILLAILTFTVIATAQAEPLVFSFADPVGDHTGMIDVTGMSFDFDNATGDYTVTLTATAANPFAGQFRVNINLFNPDAIAAGSFFSDTFNDYNLASATTSLTLTGTNPHLLAWHAGDRVATNSFPFGDPPGVTLFRSSVTNFPIGFLTNEDPIAYGAGGFTTITPPVLTVALDIKPGGFPNSVNPASNGVIPVAILSDGTFDATTVDPATVRFGANGTEATPAQYAFEDVDGDGHLDMIFHFATQATGTVCGTTSAALTGYTFGGQAIRGTDSINTVGCK